MDFQDNQDDVTATAYNNIWIKVLTVDQIEHNIQAEYLSVFNREDDYGAYMEILINKSPNNIIRAYCPQVDRTWNVQKEYIAGETGRFRGKPLSAYYSIPPVKCFNLSLQAEN